MKRAEIIAGADDDGAGRNAAAAGLEPPRLGAVDDGFAQEGDAMALGKERRELRNGLARLDADLVRTVERRREVAGAQPFAMVADLGRLEQPAFGAHVGGHELLEHGARFGAARDREQAALQDGDAGRLRHLQPHVARAHGALPAFAGLLAGHGDEAEIPDRGAIGMRVAVDDHHALAEPRGGQCMRQAANAGADHRDVE